jgi:hypothetical protein
MAAISHLHANTALLETEIPAVIIVNNVPIVLTAV